MAAIPYLQNLTAQLIDGVDRLPDEFRTKHASWLAEQQNPDGGFSGREGGSDLYYTGFALRGLAVLQGLTPEISTKAAGFLKQRMLGSASVIDLFSFMVSSFLVQIGGGPDVLATAPADWPQRVSETLESFRTKDGGYAKAHGAISGSTYHSFLVALAYELLGKPLPNMDQLVQFVRSRRREDGGYVEIAPMKKSGTNPTAAAVGILQMANALEEEARLAVSEFLADLRSDFEGGLRANGRIPAADVLSSFTGSWTLSQLGELHRLDLDGLRDYAESAEIPTGGFRGGLWDEGYDVEYTFYGVGVLGLVASATE